MMRLETSILWTLVISLTWSSAARGREERARLRLEPTTIAMDLFYYEGHVSVEGTLPAGVDAALVVRGEDEEVVMSLKGRRLRLWMTVGSATFEHAPTFYRCLTSSPIEQMVSRDVARAFGLGFEALKAPMTVQFDDKVARSPDAGRDWKGEFIKYKKKIGLYTLEEGALTIIPGQGDVETVRGDILIPARTPRGKYEVTLLGFRHGKPVAQVTGTLRVTMVGMVAFLRDLAMEHGWLYGFMAVAVALAAGLGVGFLMPSRGGGRGH